MKWTEFFWDFDGTLFDSYPRILRAFMKGLRDCGVEAREEEVLPLMKVRTLDAARRYAREDGAFPTPEDIMAAYAAHTEDEPRGTMRPYPGTEETLRAVTEAGGRNYLFTHRGNSALAALREEGLEGYFTDAVIRTMGFPAKPAPDGLLYLMNKHGLDRKKCVMIGDRSLDLESGVNAGMDCVLFDADGFGHLCTVATPCRAVTMDGLRRILMTGESEAKEI